MEKYYIIYVTYGPDDNDFYTIPVCIENGGNEEDAILKAEKEALFAIPYDALYVDHIIEITKELYEELISDYER